MRKERNKLAPFANGLFNQVDFTIGTEATNEIVVSVQLKDGVKNIGQRSRVECYLSDSAAGVGVVTTAHDGTVGIDANGNVLTALTAKKHFIIQADENGVFDLTLTETGAKTAYLVIVLPDGSLIVSGAITHAA